MACGAKPSVIVRAHQTLQARMKQPNPHSTALLDIDTCTREILLFFHPTTRRLYDSAIRT